MQKGRRTPPLLAGKQALGKGSISRMPVIANTLLLMCGLNVIEGTRANEDSLVNQ